ncbi:hypothetical protein K443DRAFT_90458, partial [Laccaria amethystina LaAM-08-1]
IPDPPTIIPCTGEGTPMAIIPPPSPAQKHRLGMHPSGERGSLVSLLNYAVHRLVVRLLSTRSHCKRYGHDGTSMFRREILL